MIDFQRISLAGYQPRSASRRDVYGIWFPKLFLIDHRASVLRVKIQNSSSTFAFTVWAGQDVRRVRLVWSPTRNPSEINRTSIPRKKKGERKNGKEKRLDPFNRLLSRNMPVSNRSIRLGEYVFCVRVPLGTLTLRLPYTSTVTNFFSS